MNIETLREYCLGKKAVDEGFPFGEDTLVFKVAGKVFLLVGLDEHPLYFNVKCDPERAISLRELHPHSVKPAYHMNKKHWNSVYIIGELNDDTLRELIDHSYELVVAGLPKKEKERLKLKD
ncbi:MmcQ/YjbR family DNA-binding protein [Olivibacter sitiensis]|uniref:MmcQ/YjbR family DNA-binding protein n=1 Tax=Olivibacter sitiensis TaxID=376470 RepID=UPI0004032723|nr:MmcQ/YjbR family DNA-binding protein [Olivibacter sitiensis]